MTSLEITLEKEEERQAGKLAKSLFLNKLLL
jgi:hypothetical protein